MFELLSGIIGAAQNHWTSSAPPKVEYKPRHDAIGAAMQRRSDALSGTGSQILATLLKGRNAAEEAGDQDSVKAMEEAMRRQQARGVEQTAPAEGTAHEQPYERPTRRRQGYL